MPKVEVIHGIEWMKIMINELPHLYLSKKPIGYQSFIDEHRLVKYVIEYYTETQTIVTEYDERTTWDEILKQLKWQKENTVGHLPSL